jgi:hypothetical protein
MKCQQVALFAEARSCIDTGVLPYIRSISAETAQLHIIAVGRLSIVKDEDKFMLRPVEGSHPTLVLCPDTKVEQGVIAILWTTTLMRAYLS